MDNPLSSDVEKGLVNERHAPWMLQLMHFDVNDNYCERRSCCFSKSQPRPQTRGGVGILILLTVLEQFLWNAIRWRDRTGKQNWYY